MGENVQTRLHWRGEVGLEIVGREYQIEAIQSWLLGVEWGERKGGGKGKGETKTKSKLMTIRRGKSMAE